MIFVAKQFETAFWQYGATQSTLKGRGRQNRHVALSFLGIEVPRLAPLLLEYSPLEILTIIIIEVA